MPVTYQRARDNVEGIVDELIDLYHAHLKEVDLSVGVRFAFPDAEEEEEPGPAVKWNGFPCLFSVKKVPLEYRMWGVRDVVITVDHSQWEDMGDDRQRAALDEALSYVAVAKDKDGNVKSDDCGRPVLKINLPSWFLTGNVAVLSRHGEAAPSAAAILETCRNYPKVRQLVLDMALEPEDVIDTVAYPAR